MKPRGRIEQIGTAEEVYGPTAASEFVAASSAAPKIVHRAASSQGPDRRRHRPIYGCVRCGPRTFAGRRADEEDRRLSFFCLSIRLALMCAFLKSPPPGPIGEE